MENIKIKDKIQRDAINHWLKVKKKGTVEITTGVGKTFIGLHALYTMPRDDKVHLFLAETIERKKDLIEEIKKYNKIFDRDVTNDYNLQFFCYQTVYKWKYKKFGLVICDEIHDQLSPSYMKFHINNTYDAIIGLSATITRDTKYEIDGRKFTKGQLLDNIAPVCYKYNLDQALKDGVSRPLQVNVIYNTLDDEEKYIPAGNQKKRFYQTEKNAYDYWDKRHKEAWFIADEEDKELQIRITSHKRSQILYNLKSKVNIVKELIKHLPSKTIIFGNSVNALEKITPNVVSSYNSDNQNNWIRQRFDRGDISIIGSFKKLKQGANLKGLDNCILLSYYSTDKDFFQRVGRLRNNGKLGNIFIILTQDTQEEKWFNKMLNGTNNIDIIYYPNINACINKIKNEKTVKEKG